MKKLTNVNSVVFFSLVKKNKSINKLEFSSKVGYLDKNVGLQFFRFLYFLIHFFFFFSDDETCVLCAAVLLLF